MVYGYVRVSTDKQSVNNQKFEIRNFAKSEGLEVNLWIEETISGTKEVNERKLGSILNRMTEGDILVCAEISRLGRNLLMIMSILNQCMIRGVKVWTIKDNYRLGDDISSKVLAFAFGLSAEVERNLVSQRTKEALARKKLEGKMLGRPKGKNNVARNKKLEGKEELIKNLLRKNVSVKTIACQLNVHRTTLTTFIQEQDLRRKIILEYKFNNPWYDKFREKLNR